MALYAKIKCGNCGHSFEMYHSDMESRREPPKCPHCFKQMTHKHWDYLVNAFLTAHDWNYQVAKSNGERGTPLFSAEFREKVVPADKITMN